jgi:hypothetical protein
MSKDLKKKGNEIFVVLRGPLWLISCRFVCDGVLRIIKAAGRWKQVEVLENGNVVATGWIDADATRKVEKVEKIK